eukprot:TRINITY_DN20488_c1_g1_i1.p1 TRINITY_DN20488_c1_g1~~TRINITY_DN20488_c1_g1_i1.p1  ORF type:complete len:323 (+),score=78.44 TRINITY_DN20488_c1_g1_i1:59-1027(+)
MVGKALEAYIESCGLAPKDVPAAVSLFVGMKYATLGTFVALGVRYRPLSRVFVKERRAAWLQKHQLRFDAAQARYPDAAARFQAARAKVKDATEARLSTVRARMQSARDAKERWQAVGSRSSSSSSGGQYGYGGQNRMLRQHQLRAFQRHEQQQQMLAKSWGGWYLWTSQKYWYLSEKLQTAATSGIWSSVIRRLGGDPKGFALGIAEGVLLTKALLPFTAATQIWLVIRLFKWKKRSQDAKAEEALLRQSTGAEDASTSSSAEDSAAAAGRTQALPQQDARSLGGRLADLSKEANAAAEDARGVLERLPLSLQGAPRPAPE